MKKAAFLFLLTAIFSCSSQLYMPEAKQATELASLSELQQGRKLYISKCSGCHALFLPEKYNYEQWQYWMIKMEPKVKMNDHEKEIILKYVSKGIK